MLLIMVPQSGRCRPLGSMRDLQEQLIYSGQKGSIKAEEDQLNLLDPT